MFEMLKENTINSVLFLNPPDKKQWGYIVEAMKPGAHLLLFSDVKNHHLGTIAAEDSGLEIRDTLAYAFANGGNNAGMQLIAMARKPLDGTVAENMLKWGTGGLNIDGCRIGGKPWKAHKATGLGSVKFFTEGDTPLIDKVPHNLGRWPANLILQDCPPVRAMFPSTHGAGNIRNSYDDPEREYSTNSVYQGGWNKLAHNPNYHGNSGGSTTRFFHSAPCLNDLCSYLLRLITPPNGTVLTLPQDLEIVGKAAKAEGFTTTSLND